jgi:hypothetical protein
MGVVHRLGEGHGSEDALADELFDFVAGSVVSTGSEEDPVG